MSISGRNILAIYLTFALQSMGQAIAWQFGTYFLKDELGVVSYVVLTIIWTMPTFVVMFGVSLWGTFSDKKGRRKPFMTIGFIGYSFTFLMLSFVANGLQFLVIAIIGAMFSSAAIPAGQALATTATAKKGERLGFLLVAQSAGWFIGAFSSGLLYDIVGMYQLYRLAAISCITATLVCIVVVKDVEFDPSGLIERVPALDLLRRPGMSRLILAAGLSSLGINSITSLMAIMIVDELGGLPSYVGLANSSATLIAVFITGYIGRTIDRKGPSGALVAAYLSYALFAIGFAFAGDPITASLLYALPIYPLSNTAAYSFAALLSGDKERGSALGLVNGSQNAGAAIGPLIGGLFADFIFFKVQPIAWIVLVFNLLAIIIAISLVPLARSMKHDETLDSLI
ncbi:MAG: MFS transporter [Candidatus Thorarchaeota archaeon]